MLDVEILHGVIETTRGTHHWDGTIFQAVNLVQSAWLIARGHQEDVRARLNFVRDCIVVGELVPDPAGICVCQRAEKVFVAAISRAQHYEHNVFAKHFMRPIRNQIETFLVCEARHNSKNRTMRMIVRQSESL